MIHLHKKLTPVMSLTLSLLLIITLSDSVQALPASISMQSFGTINYSQSLIVHRYLVSFYTYPSNMSLGTFAGLVDMVETDRTTSKVLAPIHQIRADFKYMLYRNIRAIYDEDGQLTTFIKNGWMLKDTAGNIIPCQGIRYPQFYLV